MNRQTLRCGPAARCAVSGGLAARHASTGMHIRRSSDGYLHKILNARVYDVSDETPLQEAGATELHHGERERVLLKACEIKCALAGAEDAHSYQSSRASPSPP